MLKLWAISLILEAALAVVLTRRGGFPAFRAFLWYDVATQSLGIACSGSGAWYPLVHRWSEAGAVVLLAFVVREATCKQSLHVDRGKLLASCTAVAIAIHLMFADSVPWSLWASGVWQLVALSHSIMGMYVGASKPVRRGNVLLSFWLNASTPESAGDYWHFMQPVDGESTTRLLLAFWLLADAALFYAAPHYPVGMSVLWLNAGTWAVLLISAAT